MKCEPKLRNVNPYYGVSRWHADHDRDYDHESSRLINSIRPIATFRSRLPQGVSSFEKHNNYNYKGHRSRVKARRQLTDHDHHESESEC